MELASSQEVDFFRLSLAFFLALFNTFLASLAIFSTRFLSRRSSLLSTVSPFVLNFLDLGLDVIFVGGAREGVEMRKPDGEEVESAEVGCSRALRLVEEAADDSLTSVSRAREQQGSSVVPLGQHAQPQQALKGKGEGRWDVPFSRTSLSFPFLLATISCSTGATGRITFPFMNWAYSPLLATSRLAADMAVMFKADPLAKDPIVVGSVGVETPDDCCEAYGEMIPVVVRWNTAEPGGVVGEEGSGETEREEDAWEVSEIEVGMMMDEATDEKT